MPKYHSSAVTEPLPKRTLDYLEHGAPEGTRNAELFDAACQFRDAGQSKADAESRLLARAVADGLSESEARQTIASAFNGAAREPVGTVAKGHDSRTKSRRVTGPPEPIQGGFPELLAACFRPDEYVAIAEMAEDVNGEIKPRKGVTMTTAEWLARVEKKGGIDRVFGTKLGLYWRINPMTKGGSKDADVTAYRHTLVEFDRDKTGNRIPKAEQYRRIIESGLPVAALIDSGNKSLHAIVRVDAPDAKEYQRRVDVVWKLFEGMDLDKQNRNPSRLSRCPDGWRTVDGEVRRQSLLATNLGALSWDAWETDHGKAMPSFIDLREFILNGCQPELPTVADVGIGTGMLYAGRINEIHGEPGTGKSNIAIAFSNAVMKSGGTVLYIDPEDVPAGFTRRSLQLGADPEDLMHRCQYLNDSAPGEILLAQRWAAMHRPTLVVIDGMAECMAAAGLNEDKADEVLRFIQDEVRPFAEKSGASVLISDHVTKSWEDRGLWSRGSGAKMGRYDGVSYALTLLDAYAPGQAGAVLLTVAKDRNGGVGVKGKPVVEVHFKPAPDNRTIVSFRPYQKQEAPAKPTIIMHRIENFLRELKEADKRTLRTLGKAQNVDKAIEIMEEEGTLIRTLEGNRHVFTLSPATSYKMGKSDAAES
jgi:RecA-family ATPase